MRSRAPALVRTGGEVVDAEGQVLGEHDGTFAFTVGQRRGLGVATGSPVYVLEVDAAANRVVVGPAGAPREAGAGRGPRLLGGRGRRPHDGPFEAEVRIRYRGEDVARGGHADERPGSRWSSDAAAGGGAGAERVVVRDDEVPGRRADRGGRTGGRR